MVSTLKILLNQCRSSTPMENCEDFVKLQNLCETTNDFVKDFSKISFRGGHERYIAEIVRRIDSFLKQRQYLQLHGESHTIKIVDRPACRKIFIFLLVNTAVDYDFSLEEDDSICHCLKKIPQFTQCLLANVVWGLKFDDFLYEFIRFAPAWMVTKWMDEVTISVRYGKPKEIIERCAKILEAVITNVTRATEGDGKYCVELVDKIASVLSNFNSPPKEVEEWKKMRKHEFYGLMVKHLMELALIVIKKLKNDHHEEIEEMKIYNFLPKEVSTKPLKKASKGFLEEIGNSILSTLENQVMLITAEMFIDWCEFNAVDPLSIDDDYSLQNSIGHLANEIIEANNERNTFTHDVFVKLESVKSIRRSCDETAKELSMNCLINKIESRGSINDENYKALVREFLSRGLIYNNEECLETLGEFCKSHLSFEEIGIMLTSIEAEEIDPEYRMKIGSVLKDAIDNVSPSQLIYLINFNGFEQIEFECDIEDYIFDVDIQHEKILAGIFIDPEGFFTILPDVIGNSTKFNPVAHKTTIHNYVQAVKDLMSVKFKFESKFRETILNLFTLKPNEVITQGVQTFFVELFKVKFFNDEEFIKLFILNVIETKEVPDFYLKSFYAATILVKLDMEKFKNLLPFICISFGNILDELRKKLDTVGELANDFIVTFVGVIKQLLKAGKFQENEKSCILEGVKNVQPLTKYYFENGLQPNKDNRQTFENYLHATTKINESQSQITAKLCSHLTKVSTMEMQFLTENQKYLPYFTDAMLVVVLTLPKSKFVLDFCFKNYTIAFQKIVNLDVDVEVQMTTFCRVVKILQSFSGEDQEVAFLSILPHFKKLLESIAAKDRNKQQQVESEIDKLESKDLITQIVSDLFINLHE